MSESSAFSFEERSINDCVAERRNKKRALSGGACENLFLLHAKHFNRSDSNRSSSRFHQFMTSVSLVYEHNNNYKDTLHKITLNQFSDYEKDELPLASFDQNFIAGSLHEDAKVDLSSYESVLNAALEITDRRQLENKKFYVHDEKIKSSVDNKQIWRMLNSAADILGGQETRMSSNQMHRSIGQTANFSGDVTVVEDDKFENSLNWATDENPDGVSIVHIAKDQGTCGSCWAFAATGTLEASASRRFAYDTYTQLTNNRSSLDMSNSNIVENIAQEMERSAIKVADLSVQELLDCDNSLDEGCTGGNPLLAFYFIHRYGLTSARDYSYVGEQKECKVRKVANPIATVQSWGILDSDHEDNMEMVLRLVGPLAVGVNGSDPRFLAYKSGIYYSNNCSLTANHAMLVVGYGQETDETGKVVRFWIARNSWGESWGENGFVRVKRGSGGKGEAGVCGIAKSPTVALGGTLLTKNGIKTNLFYDLDDAFNKSSKLKESLLSNYCDELGMGDLKNCDKVQSIFHTNLVIMYGVLSLFALFLVFLWTKTQDYRSRHGRNEMRHRSREVPVQDNSNTTGSQSLLGGSSQQIGYDSIKATR